MSGDGYTKLARVATILLCCDQPFCPIKGK
jgi:hypothetical protein